jgi:hypothetical protein
VAEAPPIARLPISGNYFLSRHASNARANGSRLILTALAFALMFVSVHYVMHDFDEASSDLSVQEECQVCRVNHVPAAPNSGLSLCEALPEVAYSLPTNIAWRRDSQRFPTLGARAPPLS